MPGILDPQTQGLLAAAFAGLQASGPSRMPVSLGQVFGAAGNAGTTSYDSAAKLESDLAARDVALKKAKLDLELQQAVQGGSGAPGGGAGIAADPDRLEALGTRLALAGHPGGAGILSVAEKLRAKRAAEAQLKTMKSASLPESTADVVDTATTDEAAIQAVKDAAAQGKTAAVAVDPGQKGLFSSLINSPVPAIAAQARQQQGILNSQPAGAVPPQHWLDIQKTLATQEAAHLERQANLPKSEHVIQDKTSPTGWSYEDTRSKVKTPGAPPPTTGAAAGEVVPPEAKDLHGDDYLSTLPTGMSALVKSIARGEVDLSKAASMRYGNREAIMQRVLQYDPSYNAQRSRVWQAFTDPNGKTQQNVTAINTAIGHMGTLKELTDAMRVGDQQTVNRIVSKVRTEFGKADVNNAGLAAQAVANELMRVFRQVNASESETKEFEARFGIGKASPEQMQGALKVGAELLDSRLNAIQDSWTRGMGNPDIKPPELLSAKSKAALVKISGAAAASPNAYSDAEKEKRYQEWKARQGK